MKRLLFALFVLFITQCSFAQTSIDNINFRIKDVSGLLKASNNTDNYYVLEYEGKSSSELYTNVLSSISTLYKNPDKVLSKVENVSITVSGTALEVPVPRRPDEINSVFPAKYDYYGFDYTLSFQFKDGKIRVNAPNIDTESILGDYGPVTPQFPGLHFYNSSDRITIGFEKYLNELIINILKKSETVNNW